MGMLLRRRKATPKPLPTEIKEPKVSKPTKRSKADETKKEE